MVDPDGMEDGFSVTDSVEMEHFVVVASWEDDELLSSIRTKAMG